MSLPIDVSADGDELGGLLEFIATNVPGLVLTEGLLLSAVESVLPTMFEREFEVGLAELWADGTAGWEHDDRL